MSWGLYGEYWTRNIKAPTILMKLRARQHSNEALIPKNYKAMRVALPILFLIVTPGLAFAWEFSIESSLLNLRYIYASQAGSKGFFGPFNVDMSSKGGDLAPLNGWFQTRVLTGTTAMLSSICIGSAETADEIFEAGRRTAELFQSFRHSSDRGLVISQIQQRKDCPERGS